MQKSFQITQIISHLGMAHKIKMAIQGFSDSGQNVKTIKDSSIVPAGYMHDSMGYVYYGCYTKQETVRKDSIL